LPEAPPGRAPDGVLLPPVPLLPPKLDVPAERLPPKDDALELAEGLLLPPKDEEDDPPAGEAVPGELLELEGPPNREALLGELLPAGDEGLLGVPGRDVPTVPGSLDADGLAVGPGVPLTLERPAPGRFDERAPPP
jgi:hypothetical protein